MITPFSKRAIAIIAAIPQGSVTTYGIIASHAGNGMAARQISRILHACSAKYQLPWYRVVNRQGRISLPQGDGHEEQRRLLENEGIIFEDDGSISFSQYLWWPDNFSHSGGRKINPAMDSIETNSPTIIHKVVED